MRCAGMFALAVFCAGGSPPASAGQAPSLTLFQDGFEPAGLFFRDCQAGAMPGCVAGNNSNAGTSAAPKRDLSGIDVNSLPAGTRLRFARG